MNVKFGVSTSAFSVFCDGGKVFLYNPNGSNVEVNGDVNEFEFSSHETGVGLVRRKATEEKTPAAD
ncbi:MAG: hypothetical protein HYT94_00155 [Parcubacteria group bacterium]|nr:hypothetical protein [Parcubacteria group bacterium]